MGRKKRAYYVRVAGAQYVVCSTSLVAARRTGGRMAANAGVRFATFGSIKAQRAPALDGIVQAWDYHTAQNADPLT